MACSPHIFSVLALKLCDLTVLDVVALLGLGEVSLYGSQVRLQLPDLRLKRLI